MAFFDELSRTLSDKGKEAAQKAREAAGVLQMKAQIASEKSKLKELYGAVGVLYYKKHRDEEDTEFGDLFREIGNVLTNVAAMEEKVQKMEGARVCPDCKKDDETDKEKAVMETVDQSEIVPEEEVVVTDDGEDEE